MSIINLEKIFENEQLLYLNLNNKIIECSCLTKLSKYNVDYYNKDLETFTCDKVKVITIYDIYKNIIYEPIRTDLFKDLIEICKILENTRRKTNYFFKIFMGVFIKNNKLNGIEYHINYKGTINKFLYDNILLEINCYIKKINIYINEGKCIHKFKCKKNLIIYKNYNNTIKYIICNNYIEIIKGNYPFYQTTYFYKIIHSYKKNLQILKIENI